MLDMWNEQRPSAENQTTQRWFFLFCRQAVRFASHGEIHYLLIFALLLSGITVKRSICTNHIQSLQW